MVILYHVISHLLIRADGLGAHISRALLYTYKMLLGRDYHTAMASKAKQLLKS